MTNLDRLGKRRLQDVGGQVAVSQQSGQEPSQLVPMLDVQGGDSDRAKLELVCRSQLDPRVPDGVQKYDARECGIIWQVDFSLNVKGT